MSAPDGSDHFASHLSSPAEHLSTVRALLKAETQRLLGNTIAVPDVAWRAPSRLPGWTRGHVATHLARQADGLTRLADWARTGERQEMYPSMDRRNADIEAGAGRAGVDLQIDLDTSAGRLDEAFDVLDESGGWDNVVELRGGQEAPARLLPLSRLTEVVLHHVDLEIGYNLGDIDAPTADRVLEWCAYRLRPRADFPALLLVSDSGFRARLGTAEEYRTVSGGSARLLGWLTGRGGPETLTGTQDLALPAY
jgi:maleylpyruvate isomerase